MTGFNANRTQSDGDYTGKLETYAVNAAHSRVIAPGDAVIITGTADSEGKAEVDNFAAGAITTRVTGIVASVEPQFVGENLSTTVLGASTAGKLQVQMAQGNLFDIDSDATLVAANVGLNAGFNAVDSTNSVGTSLYTLDSTSINTTVTLPLRIVALLKDADGVLGNRALVRINASTAKAGAVGV